MPDVGVLQLRISADASNASRSLKNLQDRLSQLNQAAQGLRLGDVATQIGQIVSQVSTGKGTSAAVKNLGTLLNALTAFSKVTKLGLNKTQINQIEALQQAVSGFNLGQAGTQLNKLREALGGEWNTEQAEKAKRALEVLSEGAKALNTSGTAEKIKEAANSVGQMTGGKANEIKAVNTEMAQLGQTSGRTAEALGRISSFGGSLFGRMPDHFMSMQGSVLNETAGFAESASQIKEVGTSASDASIKVKQLLDYLNTDIHYKNGKLADSINNSLGISKPAMSDQAKESLVDIWSEHISKVEAASSAISGFMSNLERPIDYSNLQQYIDQVTGITSHVKNSVNETNSLFNAPATNKDGPFKYASDEILHYTEQLNKAKEDLSFWEKEYSSIQNKIKYNGETEERTDALSHAEEGFYKSIAAVEEYQGKLKEILALTKEISAAEVDSANKVEAISRAKDSERAARDQQRLEKNYEAYRELYLSKEGNWEQTVPGMYGFTPNALIEGKTYADALKITMQEVNEYLDKFSATMDRPAGPLLSNVIDKMNGINRTAKGAEDSAKFFEKLMDIGVNFDQPFSIDNFIKSYSHIDHLKDKITELKSQLESDIRSGVINKDDIDAAIMKIVRLQNEYDNLKGKTQDTDNETKSLAQRFSELMFGAENVKGSFNGMGGVFGSFMTGIKKMFPGITGLINRFKGLIKYRMLRAVLRHITEGFSEGTKNVYEYSKAVGTSFAPAMDSAASMLAQFKNSIGAAASPLISALIPVLNQVVSAVIEAVNWLNQLFALLAGQSTWTRALPQATKAFNKQAKAAGGAGKAMKDLLADWDELNIIQSESGGGGGGGGGSTAADYAAMFEEVHEFSQDVKDVIDFIDDHMGGILGLAEQIGLAILGWKVSNAFGGLIGSLGKLLAGSMLVVIGVKLSYGSGFEAGKKGYFDTKDIIGAIGGGVAAGLGGKFIATTLFGAPAGMLGIVSGVTIAVVATIAGYIQGTREAFLDSLWGNKELSPEELQAFVNSMYKFNIVAEIQIIGASVTGLQNAKIDLDKAVVELGHTIRGVELDIESYDTLATKIQNVVDAAITYYNEQLNHEKVLIELGLSENYELALTPAASTLQNIGKNTARIMAEAQREGWDDEKEKLIKFYADYLNDVTTGAELRRKEISFRTTSSAAFANLTRGSFMAVLDEQQKRNDEFIAAIKEAKIAQAEGYEYNAAQLEEMINTGYDIGENGEVIPFDFVKKLSLVSARDTYIGLAIQARRDADEAGAKKLAESFEYQRTEVADAIRRVYGGEKNFEKQILKVGKTFSWDTATAEEIGLYYYESLAKYDPAIKKAMELYGLHVQDIIDDDLMKALFEQAYDLGGAEGVLKFGTALNMDVSDIVKFTNWDKFTSETGKDYFDALTKVFGTDATLNAIKDSGALDAVSSYGIRFGLLDNMLEDMRTHMSGIRQPNYNATIPEEFVKGNITLGDFENNKWNLIDAIEGYGNEPIPVEIEPIIADDAGTTEFFTIDAYADIGDIQWDYDSMLDKMMSGELGTFSPALYAGNPNGTGQYIDMFGQQQGNGSEGENNEALAGNIANALAPLFGNQTNSQDTTNMLLRQLLMKEFKAVVMPSAQAGFQNLASEAMMELVQGFGR